MAEQVVTRVAGDAPARAIALDGDALLSVVAAAVREGVGVWVFVRGASMMPAIPQFSEVRAVPRAGRRARRGEVVLARAAGGRPVVHRVWWAWGERLWLKGDICTAPDRSIAADAVVAHVDLVRDARGVRPIPGGFAPLAKAFLVRWWGRLKRIVT